MTQENLTKLYGDAQRLVEEKGDVSLSCAKDADSTHKIDLSAKRIVEILTAQQGHHQDNQITISAPEEIEIKKLSQCNDAFLKEYLPQLISPEDNMAVACALAVRKDVDVIIVPQNFRSQEPITISFNAKNSNQTMRAQSILIIAKEHSHVRLVEYNQSDDTITFSGIVVHVVAHSNATVEHYTLHSSHDSTHTSIVKKAHLEENATNTFVDVIAGNSPTMMDVTTHLCGKGATARQHQMILASNENSIKIKSDVIHKASDTHSTMLARAIANDQSRTDYQGTIHVALDAPRCKARQKVDSLLLSPDARCEAMPVLEVENDDVSCSHGATIAQLEQDHLYYLLSRGFTPQDARSLLVEGFCTVVAEKIKDQTMRERVLDLVREKNAAQ